MNRRRAQPAGLPLQPPSRGGASADIEAGRWWFAYGWDTRSGPLRSIVPEARSAGAAYAEGWAAAFTLNGVTARRCRAGILVGRLWSLPSAAAADQLLSCRIPKGHLTEVDVFAGQWRYRAAMAVTSNPDDDGQDPTTTLSRPGGPGGPGAPGGGLRGLWCRAVRGVLGRLPGRLARRSRCRPE